MKINHNWKNVNTAYLENLCDPWIRLIASLQDAITCYSYDFYRAKGFKTLHLPITTSSISSPMGLGSDSKPVEIELFGIKTYLADSMQFMLEYGCRLFSKGCYYIMPSFRGENADERHLCQFYHSEAEIEGNLSDVKQLVGEYVTFLASNLLQNFGREISDATHGDVSHIEKIITLNGNYPEISMQEAVDLLKSNLNEAGLVVKHDEGFWSITATGEKKLIEHFGGIVWLEHFDHLAVPFYQAFSDNGTAANADLLMGIGETIGCGERHFEYNDIIKALDLHKVAHGDYAWYCTMKQKSPLLTSGFGMGIERFILWLLKHNDIRDCQILPRFNGIKCIP